MNRKRPHIITLICIIGFAGALTAIPMAFSQQSEAIGRLYPAFLLISAILGLVCFAGLWMMKRWSVVAYAILSSMSQAVLFALGSWSITALVVPGIVIVIDLFYYEMMES